MEIPVRIKSRDIVGILVDTHFVPQTAPPALNLDPKGRLIQGPQQVQMIPLGIVAVRGGFLIGPLGDMVPLLDDAAGVDELPAEMTGSETSPPEPEFPVHGGGHDECAGTACDIKHGA